MRVTDDVMLILTNCRTEGDKLYLPGELERKTYVAVNKVLEAAGWTWNKGAKAHVSDGAAEEALDQIVLSGEVVRPQDFGFFETPDPVADMMAEEADLRPGQIMLEPNAGRGALARRMANIAGRLDCFELQAKHVAYLRAAFRGLPVNVEEQDFLNVPAAALYDRILMNPPFAKRADVWHVVHAYRFLRPGGVLVSVMSAGARFRQDAAAQDFRALVDSCGGYVEALPDDSFVESGTRVRTVMTVIPRSDAA